MLELPKVNEEIAKHRNRLLMRSFINADDIVTYLLLNHPSVIKQLRRDYYIYGHSEENSPYAWDSDNEYVHYFSKQIPYTFSFFALLIETAYPTGVKAIPTKVKTSVAFKQDFDKFVNESKLKTLGLFKFCAKKVNERYLPYDIVNYTNSFLYGYGSKSMSRAGIKLLDKIQKVDIGKKIDEIYKLLC